MSKKYKPALPVKKMKKILIISLGGSLIMPEEFDVKFLNNFKKTLRSNYQKRKFIIVCGGGTIARKYIEALKQQRKSQKELAEVGIMATRTNAQFLMKFFGKEANDSLPKNMKEVKSNLRKNNLVICGALRYAPHSTSDGTAANLAKYLNSEFLNMTNVKGLFTENPKKNPKAKMISDISWKDFEKMALSIKFRPGQNFVLDQNAATLIKKEKIPTYIIGPDMKNFSRFLSGKSFIGTRINN